MNLNLNKINVLHITNNIMEAHFKVDVTRNDIKQYGMVHPDIKEEKWTVLRVYYNTNTKEIEKSKIILDYSINSEKPEADFTLTEDQQNIIKKLLRSDYKEKAYVIHRH